MTFLSVVSWFFSHSGIHHTPLLQLGPKWRALPLFFCMKRGTVTLLWNRVFDNSLFSSALSGKSSCQQFIQQHLYVSLSLTLCVYIYLIIVRTRHPSPGLFWYENLFDPPFNHSSFQFCPSDFFIWRFLPCCLYRDVNISRKREKIQEGRKREKRGAVKWNASGS